MTVANAYHIKHVPGRKTDITDSRWIAQLELNSLIEPSRIFSGDLYDLRSLTRSRELLVQNRTELKNKIHHLLDSASIRLSSVLSDLFGKSGTIILNGLVQNKPLEEIIKSLPKKMRGSADVISATVLLRSRRLLSFFFSRTSNSWMILIWRSNFSKAESGNLWQTNHGRSKS